MTLILATSNGAQVAPVYTGPRWRCLGGGLLNYTRPHDRPTLAEGYAILGELSRQACAAVNEDNRDLARLYAREAQELCVALREAERSQPVRGFVAARSQRTP